MPAKDDKEDKVFDVAKPGKSGPSSTSKPVIVGHKNMIEDPMVKKDSIPVVDAGAEDTPDPTKVKSEEESLAPHEAKTVMPIAEDKPADDEAQPVESAPDEKPAETETEETPASSEEASSQPVTKAEEKPAEEAPAEPTVTDSVPDEPTTPAKPTEKEDKAAQEEKAREEAIQKLIENKQYVVHVGESHRRRGSKWLLIALLIVVLLLVGVDLAVDAGYIDVGFKPPIDLIKN